jgi:hypothetical protein
VAEALAEAQEPQAAQQQQTPGAVAAAAETQYLRQGRMETVALGS